MRLTQGFGALLFVVTVMGVTADRLGAQELSAQAWELETKGEAGQARQSLQKAAESRPNDAAAAPAYAEFLDRHRDPDTRMEIGSFCWRRNICMARASERMIAARRLAILDLLAGDRAAAVRHLEQYHAAGGRDLNSRRPPPSPEKTDHPNPRPSALLRPHGRAVSRIEARRPAARARAQRGHQRLSGRQRQRSAGADRIPEAGDPLSFPGPRARKTRPVQDKVIQHRNLRFHRKPASCCACSATACAAAAAAKWCWKR